MNSNKHALVVGAFVALAILSLCFLAIKASGVASEMSRASYSLTANFENISGLTKQAKVTISGVPVGQVTDITYDDKMLNAKVTMDIDQAISIDDGATASILTSGLLGEKYIGISLGAGDNLTNGEAIESTQSAVVLEELISKFLFNKTTKEPEPAAEL